MNKKGFTLTEVIVVVIIVGVLASIALPMYARSVERARATEAMSAVKAMNDAIYAFFAEREVCPTQFRQLVVNMPVSNLNSSSIQTQHFQFDMGSNVQTRAVPGTTCPGVLATRIHGGRYSYKIWNPYTRSTTDNGFSLQCAPVTTGDKTNIAVCESLGLYRAATEE